VQLLADASRGWAWTRALLGLRADAVHVAGDPSAVALVAALAARAGDSFEERRYARFTPLAVQAGGLEGGAAGWAGVAPGDCVVAFSRRDIFAIKAGVEAATPHRAAVVYGALPPETRRQQVRGWRALDLGFVCFVHFI
jgi:ATP-dependent RNA helicase SUPV3L1/SUV3